MSDNYLNIFLFIALIGLLLGKAETSAIWIIKNLNDRYWFGPCWDWAYI